MASDRERIEAMERTVRLLAEATRDALQAIYDREYHGTASYGETKSTLNAVLGRLDAVLSPLGVASPDPARPGTDGEGLSDGTREGGPT